MENRDARSLPGGAMSGRQPQRPLRLFLGASGAADVDARWGMEAIAALAARGHLLELAAPAESAFGRALKAGPAALVPLRLDRRFDPWMLGRLRGAIATSAPEALLALDARAAVTLFIASRFVATPPVLLQVGCEPPSAPGVPRAAPQGRLSARIIERRLRPAVATLPRGVTPDRIAARRRLGLPRHGALLLVVGNFEPDTGHRTLLAALGELVRRRAASASVLPVPTLVFVGSGAEEHELRAQAQELGIRDRILWLGFVNDLRAHLLAADLVFVADPRPSARWVVLDALACGVAVIAPDSPESRTFIEPDRSGILFRSGDSHGLMAALDGMLLDPQQATKLGAAGRARVETTWSHATLALELESLVYAQLLRRAGWARGKRGRRALLVDRDGTLVFNQPYNADPARLRLEPEVGPALRAIRDAGAAVVVVSNQSAVARGMCTEADVRATNECLGGLLEEAGAGFDAVYFCPHHPDFGLACTCRKPEPGMLLQAARDLGLDLGASFTVGDAGRDLEAGRRAGTQVLLYGRECATAGAVDAESGDVGVTASTDSYDNWLELVRDLLGSEWEGTRAAGA